MCHDCQRGKLPTMGSSFQNLNTGDVVVGANGEEIYLATSPSQCSTATAEPSIRLAA